MVIRILPYPEVVGTAELTEDMPLAMFKVLLHSCIGVSVAGVEKLHLIIPNAKPKKGDLYTRLVFSRRWDNYNGFLGHVRELTKAGGSAEIQAKVLLRKPDHMKKFGKGGSGGQTSVTAKRKIKALESGRKAKSTKLNQDTEGTKGEGQEETSPVMHNPGNKEGEPGDVSSAIKHKAGAKEDEHGDGSSLLNLKAGSTKDGSAVHKRKSRGLRR